MADRARDREGGDVTTRGSVGNKKERESEKKNRYKCTRAFKNGFGRYEIIQINL